MVDAVPSPGGSGARPGSGSVAFDRGTGRPRSERLRLIDHSIKPVSDDASTREELLEAAYEVLVDPEIEGFTTAAVAEAAGRNQSLVHYHFDTKGDLVIDLFEYLHEVSDVPFDADGPAEAPRERLETLLLSLVWTEDDAAPHEGTAEEARQFKRGLLWLSSKAVTDEELRAAMAADFESLWESVHATIEAGQAAGDFREDVDAEAATALFLAAAGGAQTWDAMYGEDARDDLVVDAMRTLIEEWLVA